MREKIMLRREKNNNSARRKKVLCHMPIFLSSKKKQGEKINRNGKISYLHATSSPLRGDHQSATGQGRCHLPKPASSPDQPPQSKKSAHDLRKFFNSRLNKHVSVIADK